MPSLASMLPGFKLPTPEEMAEMDRRAREDDEREENRRYLERIQKSHIPVIFRDADVSECDGVIRRWVLMTLNENQRKDLIIMGKPGRGKSYAACACGNSLLRRYEVLFSDAKDMLDDIQACYSSSDSEQETIARYTLPKFLIVDDLGESEPTEWTVTRLFQIIKRRHAMARPTIYTTMYTPERLAKRLVSANDREKKEAIFSRFSEAVTVHLQGEDRRRQCKTA